MPEVSFDSLFSELNQSVAQGWLCELIWALQMSMLKVLELSFDFVGVFLASGLARLSFLIKNLGLLATRRETIKPDHRTSWSDGRFKRAMGMSDRV